MLKLTYLQRIQRFLHIKQKALPRLIFRGFSDEKGKKGDTPEGKTGEAQNKLNDLLKSMIENQNTISAEKRVKLAQPVSKRKTAKEQKSEQPKPFEERVVSAAKEVAQQIGGDVKQTESELLSKLLKPSSVEETKPQNTLSDIVKDMKIDREMKAPEEISRAQQIRQLIAMVKENEVGAPPHDRKVRRTAKVEPKHADVTREKIDLFGAKPLGIFTTGVSVPTTDTPVNETWDELYKRELRLAVTHPPANYFQQMILWTQQGKVWKFPIDNEQGMENEQSVSFVDHVFLEKHLEPWCPTKGPVRHFMELVCVGLSKNPYMSVETKKGHIEWYRNYFEEKKEVLMEVGALPIQENLNKKE